MSHNSLVVHADGDNLSLSVIDKDSGEIEYSGSLLQVISSVGADMGALSSFYDVIKNKMAGLDRGDWNFHMQSVGNGFRVNRAHKVFYQFMAGDAVSERLKTVREEYTNKTSQTTQDTSGVRQTMGDAIRQVWLDAAQSLGLETKTVMNMVDVAEAYPLPEQRVFLLPFGHYDELRSEDPALRDALLSAAADAVPVWSRDKLRAERASIRRSGQSSSATQSSNRDDTMSLVMDMFQRDDVPDNEEQDEDGDDEFLLFPLAGTPETPATILRRIISTWEDYNDKIIKAYLAMAKRTGDDATISYAIRRARASIERANKVKNAFDTLIEQMEVNETNVIDGRISS